MQTDRYGNNQAALTDMLRQRIDSAQAQMVNDLNQRLYGDTPGFVPKRLSWAEWLSMWKWRFMNAWDVLRGRADIC